MEIRVNDLMVGDWLLYKSDSLENAFPIQVTREMFNKELVVWNDRFEPIQLTPEILEKNGLNNDPLGCHFDEDEYMLLEISSEKEGIYWTINYNEYGILELKYVHELQHALRLCKIEKEIMI